MENKDNKTISQLISELENDTKQPIRFARKEAHIKAAEEITKDEKVLFAFLAKRGNTQDYSVICLTNKRIVAVQSTITGMYLTYTILWKFITGVEISGVSKVFTSANLKIHGIGMSLNLQKISKNTIRIIEKNVLDIWMLENK